MNTCPPREHLLPASLAIALATALAGNAAWAANGAAFVSQSVLATAARGAAIHAELTMRNTGDTTWTRAAGFILGSENPQDNDIWGTNRVWMDSAASVPPGSQYTFKADLTAPAQDGAYNFQWRMLQDAVEWFGDRSANVQVQVSAPVFACDGTEVLCLDLRSQPAAEASGGVVVGGDFNGDGFQPSSKGGVDWQFGPDRDFSAGEFEVDVKGLLPSLGGEQEGGKVSIFDFCGVAPQDNEGVGIQKMTFDYRDGHIFRYGMDDDGLADNWDAVIITAADFQCYYSVNDPPWQSGETHHIRAAWSPAGLDLSIDGAFSCSKGGNGDTFDPQSKVFTIANRCTHFANQQAVARFTNLRLWARGPNNPDTGTPDAGADDAGAPDTGDEDAGVADAGSDGSELPDASGVSDTGVTDAGIDNVQDTGRGGRVEPIGTEEIAGCGCTTVGVE